MTTKIALCALLSILAITNLFAEPEAPEDSVVKPTFMTGDTSFSGGTAFLCQVNQLNLNLVMTCHHLFGPACGWEEEFEWNKLEETFKAMTGLAINNPSRFVTSSELLIIPGAEGLNDKGFDKDIAAWIIPDQCKLPKLTLAIAPPKVGEKVYLFARLRGSEKLDLVPAKVTISNKRELEFTFEDHPVALSGTSGAPVLNKDGEVVAINIGGGEDDNQTFGVGNPVDSIVKMLAIARNARK